ncbi:MAG: plastocyanin/azurin family copper-binding protein [Planctomycetota bacterium]|nr:plastocyanin/azurin family copper-binding protein [Planctomycetota bacterium]MDA1113455.1 plastocyanin/azurin family copper-binding protein [Planctomycetota bacterium]
MKTSLFRASTVFAIGFLLSGVASAQNNHTVQVAESGFTFTPQDININMGDTITWVWNGAISHNVDSDIAGVFRSGLPVAAPNTFSVTFDALFIAANPVAADLYTYHCDPHQAIGMVGSIQVMAPRVLSLTNFSAGQFGTMNVDGLNAGGTVLIGYSTAGNSPLSVSFGTLSLSPPINQLPGLTANAAGHAELSVNLPPGLAGATVHLHAAELFGGGAGILTNPVTVVL